MNFSHVIGQDIIISMLKKDISNNTLGHAYLFHGPRGIGKYSLASAFALAVNCKGTSLGCESCSHCVKLLNSNHPDVKVIDTSTQSIGVDLIRETVVEDVNTKPYLDGHKIYIIKSSDKMTPQAQNALLKTLEEPPKGVIIILLCENLQSLLPTVLSRCQKYQLKSLGNSQVEQYLIKNLSLSPQRAHTIAALSQGLIGAAKEFAQNENFNILRDKAGETVKNMVEGDNLKLITMLDFFEDHKDNIDIIFQIISSYFRDIALYLLNQDIPKLINQDKIEEIKILARNKKYLAFIEALDIINNAKNNLRFNSNYQLNIEVMLLKIQEVLT